jgi:hypothetical protein
MEFKTVGTIFLGNATPEFREKRVKGEFGFERRSTAERILNLNGFVFLTNVQDKDFYRDIYGNIAYTFLKKKGCTKRDKKLFQLYINV